MKIKISYKPDEEKEATAAVVAFLRLHPGAKVHKSDKHAPFMHIYMATTKPEKRCGSKENA